MTNTSAKKVSIIEINKALGKKIKDLREISRITQEQLSEKASLSQNFISQLENGRKSASIDTLCRISVAMEVPVSLFFDIIDCSKSTHAPVDQLEKQICFQVKSMSAKEKKHCLESIKLNKKFK